VKHFRYEERHVAYYDDDQRFHDADVMSEPRQEPAEQSENDSDSRSADDVDEERSDSGDDVDDLDVFDSDLTESVEQMVEHLYIKI